jgi:hypothetical protein
MQFIVQEYINAFLWLQLLIVRTHSRDFPLGKPVQFGDYSDPDPDPGPSSIFLYPSLSNSLFRLATYVPATGTSRTVMRLRRASEL